MLASLVVIIGFGVLGVFAFDAAPADGPGGQGASDPVSIALGGVTLGQLIVGVLGAVVVTNEYGIGGFTFVVSLVRVFLSFASQPASQTVLSGHGDPADGLGDGGVLRAVNGVSVIGAILGTLLRSTAGAIATLFGVVVLFPTLIGLVLPDSWNDAITGYLPSNAGGSFMTLDPRGASLSPRSGPPRRRLIGSGELTVAAVRCRDDVVPSHPSTPGAPGARVPVPRHRPDLAGGGAHPGRRRGLDDR